MLDLLLAAFGTSLLTGMRHATDPDHVVAVTTIVARERSVRRAALVGAQWGLGHTLTIMLVGALIVGLKLTITPRMGLSMELAVAAMLIVLGVLNLFGARPAHARVHEAAAEAGGIETAGAAPPADRGRTIPPFLVGTVHGLAGSAAATLFVTGLIPDPRWAMAFLGVFGAATILGMTLVTLLLALPSLYAASRMAALQRGLRVASGVASIVFGLWLAHQIGFEDGLFGATPRWDAH
jgi:high-affinity nickel-transport protein